MHLFPLLINGWHISFFIKGCIIYLILALLNVQLKYFHMSCLSTSKLCLDKVAQSVGDETVNQEVRGSNPCYNFVGFFLMPGKAQTPSVSIGLTDCWWTVTPEVAGSTLMRVRVLKWTSQSIKINTAVEVTLEERAWWHSGIVPDKKISATQVQILPLMVTVLSFYSKSA